MKQGLIVEGGLSRNEQLRAFIACSTGLSLLGAISSAVTVKGGVWFDHLRSGKLLLSGHVPDNPTYPIWGYSIFAAVFGDSLLWIQAALAVAVATWWFRIVMERSGVDGFYASRRFAVLIALALLPWFAVVTTYFSNSIACILALMACCLLWRADMTGLWTWRTILAGLILGLAANIRGEFLVISFLLSICVLFSGWLAGKDRTPSTKPFVNTSLLLASVLAAMIPWAVFTKAVTGEYRLTSSNSGAVSYLGLGLLPNNPWNIVAKDEYVDNIALKDIGSNSAWTIASDQYFKTLYNEAILREPIAFARRLILGWKIMLLQGMYVPNMRQVLITEKNDELVASFAVEQIKNNLSLSADLYTIDRARSAGVGLRHLKGHHIAVIACEILLRTFTVILLLGLMAVLIFRLVSQWPYTFVGWTALAFVIVLFLISGFVQTSPRHSTLLLPIVLGALLMSKRRVQTLYHNQKSI